MLPIVMGARPHDYAKVAPRHSYIHVDEFAGPQELAHYLRHLVNNDTQYGEYFRWKQTLEIAEYDDNTRLWCRLCTLLNYQVNCYVSVTEIIVSDTKTLVVGSRR